MAKGTGTYDDPIIVDGLFAKTIDGVKKFFKLKTGASVDTSQFVKKSGDKLTGAQFTRNLNNNSLHLMGGYNWFSGASLELTGKDYELGHGGFRLDASSFIDNDSTKGNYSRLEGTVAGSLKWCAKEVERVNSIGFNYIRYESGLQIEWGNHATSSKKDTVNFLMPFKYPPTMAVTLDGSTSDDSAVNFIGYAHPSSANFILFSNWGSGMICMYIAIGKWK